MKTIDLKSIIEKQELGVNEIARQLFPNNKYSRLALNRVMAGKAVLDANQISKLSLLTGIPIPFLFSGEEWGSKAVKDEHIFTNGDFKAVLDTKTWTTKVFHLDSLFHESIIHSGAIPISEYLDSINSIILKFVKK